jgi:hypothetical protein
MEGLKMKTIELYTWDTAHEDLVFEVSEEWLQNKLDISVKQFLSEYTFTDTDKLYQVAVSEGKVISTKIVDAEV